MNPMEIIETYYPPGSRRHDIFLMHGRSVAARALAVADNLGGEFPDRRFIEEAALLHDIGIFMTRTPQIGCFGEYPYICHGYLGRQLLEQRGLFAHALVCERHVGVGISAEEIRKRRLPLPERDMQPVSLEEEIICYADKFFSKTMIGEHHEKSIEEIVDTLKSFGQEKADKFLFWANRFER